MSSPDADLPAGAPSRQLDGYGPESGHNRPTVTDHRPGLPAGVEEPGPTDPPDPPDHPDPPGEPGPTDQPGGTGKPGGRGGPGGRSGRRDGEHTDRTPSGLFRLERPPLADGPAEGAVVLLVHGSMDRASSFRRVMRHLPDVTVLTYDRRGYADSIDVPASDDFDVQAYDLLEVLDGRRAVGVGHSLGGNVVLAAAARRPDLLDSLVVYETPQPWRSWWPTGTAGGQALSRSGDPGEVAEGFMRRMVGDRVWRTLPEATRRRRREEGVALQAEMRALHHGAPFDPARIEVPVVVACGSDGSDHQRRSAPVLASELPAGRPVEVAGAGHGVHLSHPEQLAALVRMVIETRQGRR